MRILPGRRDIPHEAIHLNGVERIFVRFEMQISARRRASRGAPGSRDQTRTVEAAGTSLWDEPGHDDLKMGGCFGLQVLQPERNPL
jgi:hypothetical protein